jgi:hypothetical protein
MYGSLRGVPVSCEPIWLTPKLPSAVRGYRYEINPLDAQVLSSLSLAAAPSGTGELAISALSFAAGVVTFTLAAGQPTRCYTLLLGATRSDGMVSGYVFRCRLIQSSPRIRRRLRPRRGSARPLPGQPHSRRTEGPLARATWLDDETALGDIPLAPLFLCPERGVFGARQETVDLSRSSMATH